MRTGRSGLTLIEILLAMLVFVVGIVGVMALFPTALYTSQQSIEEQRAAMIVESVKNAIDMALRNVRTAPTTTVRAEVVFTHDFKLTNGDQQIYGEAGEFDLPFLADGWRRFPGNVAATTAATAPADAAVFMLGGDGWLVGTSDWVIDQNDPSENYRNWAYCFDVRKANTMTWLTGADVDLKVQLYEFTIYVYRRRPHVDGTPGFDNILILRASHRAALR